MSGKGNEAYEKLDREIGAKYGHLIQRKALDNLWGSFIAGARAREFAAAPEQELADDYERNQHG